MPITINGSGTVTGITAGGLPDAIITPAELTQPLTQAASQATTSGTLKEFTGIPSWVRRITVMLSGVSTSGTSQLIVQIGSTTYSTSGYVSSASYGSGTATVQYDNETTGFLLEPTGFSTAAALRNGALVLLNVSSNTWIAMGNTTSTATNTSTTACAGTAPSLGGVLDRVRLTTVNGTDTFDAGVVNILYE